MGHQWGTNGAPPARPLADPAKHWTGCVDFRTMPAPGTGLGRGVMGVMRKGEGMKFGFNLPVRGAAARRDNILRILDRGEQAGYDTFAVTDHIVVPKDIRSRYPYSEDGSFPGGMSGEYTEPLSLMAFAAAATRRARLLTSILVIPYRHPLLSAKMLASIDMLSGGRVTLGCGTGWMREEFEAIGAPDFDARGRVTDEYIAAFREAWTADDPAFEGSFVKFSDLTILPKPAQAGGPPIWTGGESGPAMRRAGRIADGWFPIGGNPRFPLDTVARYQKGRDKVRAIAREAGRKPDSVALGYWTYGPKDAPETTDDGDRVLFTGSRQDQIDDVRRMEDAGLSYLQVMMLRTTADETLDAISSFADEVIAKV